MYSKKSNPNYEDPHKPQIFYIISVENKLPNKLLSIQTFLFTIKNSRKTSLSTRHNILLCSRKKQSKLWRGPSSQFTTNVLLKVVPKGDKWRKSGLRGAPYSTQGHRQEFKTVGANFNLFSYSPLSFGPVSAHSYDLISFWFESMDTSAPVFKTNGCKFLCNNRILIKNLVYNCTSP